MNRYLCACGKDFKNRYLAAAHLDDVKLSNDYHAVVELHWKGRLVNFLLDPDNFRIFIKGAAFSMIYFTVCNHFDVHFNILEGALIGGGVGLLLGIGNIDK